MQQKSKSVQKTKSSQLVSISAYLRLSMYLVIPLEVRCDGEFNTQRLASDRLNMNGQIEFRQLVDVLMQRLAVLWDADQLSDLVLVEVVESLPRDVLLLELSQDVLRDLLELTQRRHRLPPAPNTDKHRCRQLNFLSLSIRGRVPSHLTFPQTAYGQLTHYS